MILGTILNLLGNGLICDLTLSMTGLYFFLVAENMSVKSEGMVYLSSGSESLVETLCCESTG